MYARACVKESNVQRAKVYLGEIVRDRERERSVRVRVYLRLRVFKLMYLHMCPCVCMRACAKIPSVAPPKIIMLLCATVANPIECRAQGPACAMRRELGLRWVYARCAEFDLQTNCSACACTYRFQIWRSYLSWSTAASRYQAARNPPEYQNLLQMRKHVRKERDKIHSNGKLWPWIFRYRQHEIQWKMGTRVENEGPTLLPKRVRVLGFGG